MNERMRSDRPNRRTRRLRIAPAAITGAVLVAGWIILAACSNNGEGERCQIQNFSDDCQDGLVCLPKAQVASNEYNNADRCCPPDRAQATHEACKERRAGVTGDATPPADSGPTDLDSGQETSTDGAPDGSDAGDAADLDAADAADG